MNMENNERAYKDELVQKISDLFLTFGLRSTSMDDIANHLKISKKTLYQYFGNKDDVVEQVMLFRIYDKRGRSELGETERQNPIAVIGYVKRFVINMLDTRIPANDFDMKKYHPAVYAKVKAAHEKLTKDFLSSLLDQGIKAGYFRPDIDRDFDQNKEQIKKLIASELMKRYYYQRGELINSLQNDPVLDKALEVLTDEALYRKTLSTPEEQS